MVKRYVSFIRNILKSSKKPLRKLIHLVKDDVRTITGSNLRRIMLWSGKDSVDQVFDEQVDIEYHEIEDDEVWKVEMIREVNDALHGCTETNLDREQLGDVLKFLCTG